MQQVKNLHNQFDQLQKKYGGTNLSSIYGTGCVDSPQIMFIFMNPTGKNVSSDLNWKGLRAPWLGTKQVWNIFNDLGLLSNEIYEKAVSLKAQDWSVEFADTIYSDIEKSGVYITNLAKCTQIDARPLSNKLFKEYLALMYKEIETVNPKKIVTFGNQVSSIVLGKSISVSDYTDDEYEILKLKSDYKVFPTYYPVGQGRRNMPLAIRRLKLINEESILN